MRKPEPEHIDPLPVAQISDEDEYKAPHDKGDNCDMQCQRNIREYLIKQVFTHLRYLSVKP